MKRLDKGSVGEMVSELFSRMVDGRDPRSLAARFRRARFVQFVQLLGVGPADRILDVGGYPGTWLGSGLERQVTLLNLSFREQPAPFEYLVADARAMSAVPTGAFDVVHSNSLIEHVGGWDDQQAVAREIDRVGRRYWVQTPYRHFPLEAHFLFPFFQYLTPGLQRRIALWWPLSHYKRDGGSDAVIVDELSRLRPLDRKDLRALFPQAEIFAETIAGWPKSLVAYRR